MLPSLYNKESSNKLSFRPRNLWQRSAARIAGCIDAIRHTLVCRLVNWTMFRRLQSYTNICHTARKCGTQMPTKSNNNDTATIVSDIQYSTKQFSHPRMYIKQEALLLQRYCAKRLSVEILQL